MYEHDINIDWIHYVRQHKLHEKLELSTQQRLEYWKEYKNEMDNKKTDGTDQLGWTDANPSWFSNVTRSG